MTHPSKPLVRYLPPATPWGQSYRLTVLDHPDFPPGAVVRTSRVLHVDPASATFETLNHRYVPVVGPSLADVRVILSHIAHSAA